ncbi:MAG: right-handed parallel beta-helix repeat-containing protein [Bryobacteraceae bacterium]
MQTKTLKTNMLNLLFRLPLVCAALTAVTGSLPAATGVILIDQGAAMAGNVTPGDAPGFPVTISQPGSYRLTGNLTVPDENTTAILITANSVTLDLDGFTVSGPVTCTGSPITCSAGGSGIGIQANGTQTVGLSAVRIRNGSVHGMGNNGVQLTGTGTSVEKVTAYGNSAGGIAATTVIDSEAVQNGSFGFLATSVRNSTSSQNGGDGIILNGQGGVASSNLSSFNAGYGIWAPYGTIMGNSVFLNSQSGILVHCPASIIANTVVSSNADNVRTNGSGCIILNGTSQP